MKRETAIRTTAWVLIALAPLFFLGLAEAVARLLDLQPRLEAEMTVPAWLDQNVLVKESHWIEQLTSSPTELRNYYRSYRPDRYLFYRLAPGLELPMTDVTAPPALRERTRWTFRTNSKGYNARESNYEKPPGVFRIVTMGDSSTFGWGVESAESYPHVLESLLAARHPRLEIEVINLGVNGYSSLQGLVLLQREALDWHPDLLVFSYGSNDYSLVPEPYATAYRRSLGWIGAVRDALDGSRAYQVYAAWLSGFSRSLAAKRDGSGTAQGVLNVGPTRSYENLAEMARVSLEHRIDPVFVTNCVPGKMAEPVRAAAAKSGAPLLDTKPLLEEAARRMVEDVAFSSEIAYYRELYGEERLHELPWLTVYLTDRCHPSRLGHRLIAEALAPLIEATPAFSRAADEAR